MSWIYGPDGATAVQSANITHFFLNSLGKGHVCFNGPYTGDCQIPIGDINSAVNLLNGQRQPDEPCYVFLGTVVVNPANVCYLEDLPGGSSTNVIFPGPDGMPYYARQIASPIQSVVNALQAPPNDSTIVKLAVLGRYRINPRWINYIAPIDTSSSQIFLSGPPNTTFGRITVPLTVPEILTQIYGAGFSESIKRVVVKDGGEK